MQRASMGYVECQLGGPGIVAVRQRQPCSNKYISAGNPRGKLTDVTISIEDGVPPGMLELPAFLDLRPTVAAQSAAVSAENVDRLQHDDIRRLRTLVVLARPCLVEQLRRGDGREVRRV